MTLFKQLALLLSLFLLLILTTVTVLNFTSTIENAKQHLYSDAQNTAASLSLSLATANGDESTMATMMMPTGLSFIVPSFFSQFVPM